MHLERQKPKFQIRILEYEKEGTTFKKKSKSSNIYPNTKNYTLEQLWKKLKEVIENV
jgi:lambda repressor-like predicted transcriptional regulator